MRVRPRTRGARIKATSASGSITLGWDHALNPAANHKAAAMALAKRNGSEGATWHGATGKDGAMHWVRGGIETFAT